MKLRMLYYKEDRRWYGGVPTNLKPWSMKTTDETLWDYNNETRNPKPYLTRKLK